MLVLDPVVIALNKIPPWALALGGIVVAAALLPTRSKSKSRKIHSLGTKIPIIGGMLEVNKHLDARHDWIAAMSLRFQNEPWQINTPGSPTMIMLSDPATIEDVVVNQTHVFNTAEQREVMHDLFGDGILNVDGEQWYHQRKTAAKFFSARTLRLCMMKTMQRNVDQVYETLDAQCGTGSYVNLTNLFQQFALQTFLEVGVGIDAPIIGKSEPGAFKAVDEAALLFAQRRMLPHYVWKLQRWLNVGNEKRLKELMESVHTYVNQLVKQALSTKTNEPSGRDESERIRTVVELFVEHSGDDDKAGLRPWDLVDFVLNFVLAARDTSSLTTQWLFYQLSQHPEVEAKLRAEFAAKLPQLGVGRDGYITADHVKQLVYLEAVKQNSPLRMLRFPLGKTRGKPAAISVDKTRVVYLSLDTIEVRSGTHPVEQLSLQLSCKLTSQATFLNAFFPTCKTPPPSPLDRSPSSGPLTRRNWRPTRTCASTRSNARSQRSQPSGPNRSMARISTCRWRRCVYGWWTKQRQSGGPEPTWESQWRLCSRGAAPRGNGPMVSCPAIDWVQPAQCSTSSLARTFAIPA